MAGSRMLGDDFDQGGLNKAMPPDCEGQQENAGKNAQATKNRDLDPGGS